MAEQERPLSTSDLAEPRAPEGAGDTTAMPMESSGAEAQAGTAAPADTRATGEDAAEAGADVQLTGSPVGQAGTTGQAAGTGTTAEAPEPPQALLGESQTGDFRQRWEQIQAAFVDEPRRAVQDADTLVAEVMQRLAETFARARGDLESQWSRGAEVGTEELRVALQRYRAFFELLLRR